MNEIALPETLRPPSRPLMDAINRALPSRTGVFTVWRERSKGIEDPGECDLRAAILPEISSAMVKLMTCLKNGERQVRGTDNLQRLRADNYIRLGPGFGLAVLENQTWPKEWAGKKVFFDGLVLSSPNRNACTLYVRWHAEKRKVVAGYELLVGFRTADSPSAVIPGPPLPPT